MCTYKHLQELLQESVIHLSENETEHVEELLLFIGRTSLVKHTIDTGDARPVKQ